jgi:2-polyprenyl-3-methyl-5-hydroxy-6-metoxy-1,4-benzoquinol methylase
MQGHATTWPDLITEDQIDLAKAYEAMGDNFVAHRAHSRNYYAWVASTIRPYLGRRAMELGAGPGLLSEHLTDLDLFIVTETWGPFLAELSEMARLHGGVEVEQLDATTLAPHVKRFRKIKLDSIFSSNVIEHIKDDVEVLAMMGEAVGPGGRVVNFVPALRMLYGVVDKTLGHYRRYEKEELAAKMQAAGLEVEKVFFFNLPGCLAWFILNKVLKDENASSGQFSVFNAIVPLIRLFETVFPVPIGASLVGVGRVKAR